MSDIFDSLLRWAGRRPKKAKPAMEDSYDTHGPRLLPPEPRKREPDPLYGPQVPPAPVTKRVELPKQPQTTRRERKQKMLEALKSVHTPIDYRYDN
jgi:hypothetical protein